MTYLTTNKKTFMQNYREYSQLSLVGKFGSKRPSLNPLVVSRYGLELARLIERYDNLNHRIPLCNVNQRVNLRYFFWRAQTIKGASYCQKEVLRLNKMWKSWDISK